LFDQHALPPHLGRCLSTIIYELRNFNFLFDNSPLYHLVEEKKVT
jgi:hypothetical protein